MIFVTVGTHEQQFNRLVKYIDELNLDEEVFIQTGYSDYIPKNCKYSQMISAADMDKYCDEARIVITHGGPGSIMKPLLLGKKPIVVPRQAKFDEHINDHQVLFSTKLGDENKVFTILDIEELGDLIKNYDELVKDEKVKFVSNNKKFNEDFSKIVDDLFKKKRGE